MRTFVTAISLMLLTTPALAERVNGEVKDHYKTIIEQKPYSVEVCKNVQVPYGSKTELDTEGAIVGGIIGGIIGNQVGKGSGKEAATGVGALAGAIIGGKKEGTSGYRLERQCQIETRYEERSREVYSHSTITFTYDGTRKTVTFSK
jgi:uncharacterized protein YcfJ